MTLFLHVALVFLLQLALVHHVLHIAELLQQEPSHDIGIDRRLRVLLQLREFLSRLFLQTLATFLRQLDHLIIVLEQAAVRKTLHDASLLLTSEIAFHRVTEHVVHVFPAHHGHDLISRPLVHVVRFADHIIICLGEDIILTAAEQDDAGALSAIILSIYDIRHADLTIGHFERILIADDLIGDRIAVDIQMKIRADPEILIQSVQEPECLSLPCLRLIFFDHPQVVFQISVE